jgi:hypothetical protein
MKLYGADDIICAGFGYNSRGRHISRIGTTIIVMAVMPTAIAPMYRTGAMWTEM